MEIKINSWGYINTSNKFVKTVDVRFQQTGPKNGIWVLAEKWIPYKDKK